MRNSLLRLALLMVVFICTTTQVNAIDFEQKTLTADPIAFSSIVEGEQKTGGYTAPSKTIDNKDTSVKDTTAKAGREVAPKPIEPTKYAVVAGDNLSSIASNHRTTWLRLFDKNTQIVDPDVLNVGDILTIPNINEELPERLPPVITPVQKINASQPQAVSTPPRVVASSAGNTYAPGYCTWYAKSRRPDLPNRMGNAISWVSSAAANGYATGGVPKAGAIGQQGNHVVYVESVNSDGSVTVSEMNYKGLYVVSTRTVPAGSFSYIY